MAGVESMTYLGKEVLMEGTRQELIDHMLVLLVEIHFLKSRIEPHDCGHIHTTISTLECRVKELKDQLSEENKVIS